MHTVNNSNPVVTPEAIHLVAEHESKSEHESKPEQANQSQQTFLAEEVEPTKKTSAWGIGLTTPLLMFSLHLLGNYSDIFLKFSSVNSYCNDNH